MKRLLLLAACIFITAPLLGEADPFSRPPGFRDAFGSQDQSSSTSRSRQADVVKKYSLQNPQSWAQAQAIANQIKATAAKKYREGNSKVNMQDRRSKLDGSYTDNSRYRAEGKRLLAESKQLGQEAAHIEAAITEIQKNYIELPDAAVVTGMREWTSKDGQRKITARVLSVNGGQLLLHREDGLILNVAKAFFSEADIIFLDEKMFLKPYVYIPDTYEKYRLNGALIKATGGTVRAWKFKGSDMSVTGQLVKDEEYSLIVGSAEGQFYRLPVLKLDEETTTALKAYRYLSGLVIDDQQLLNRLETMASGSGAFIEHAWELQYDTEILGQLVDVRDNEAVLRTKGKAYYLVPLSDVGNEYAEELARGRILLGGRLFPEAYELDRLSEAFKVAEASEREWAFKSTDMKLEARLVRDEGNNLVLGSTDGDFYRIPLGQFTKETQMALQAYRDSLKLTNTATVQVAPVVAEPAMIAETVGPTQELTVEEHKIATATESTPLISLQTFKNYINNGGSINLTEAISAGIDINMKGEGGMDALMRSILDNQFQYTEILIHGGANLGSVDELGFTPIFYASNNGNEPILKLLLDGGVSVNHASNNDMTALVLAVGQGHIGCASTLLKHGANPNLKSESGATALMSAAGTGRSDIIQLLLSHSAEVDAMDHHGWTALMFAAAYNRQAALDVLLKSNADPDIQGSEFGSSALLVATEKGFNDISKSLISARSNLDLKNKNGDTALSIAAILGQAELVELLIDHDVNIESKSKEYGVTPLMLAASAGHADVVNLLISAGADVNARDRNNYSALIHSEGVECVSLLLGAGADPNYKDSEYGMTCMLVAVTKNDVEVVSALVGAGADANIQNEDGATALMGATIWNNYEMVDLLLKGGADPNIQRNSGMTALMDSTKTKSNRAILELLINYGADINTTEFDQSANALMLAIDDQSIGSAKVLLSKGASLNHQTKIGATALMVASASGETGFVLDLLSLGADPTLKTSDGATALGMAQNSGNYDIAFLFGGAPSSFERSILLTRRALWIIWMRHWLLLCAIFTCCVFIISKLSKSRVTIINSSLVSVALLLIILLNSASYSSILSIDNKDSASLTNSEKSTNQRLWPESKAWNSDDKKFYKLSGGRPIIMNSSWSDPLNRSPLSEGIYIDDFTSSEVAYFSRISSRNYEINPWEVKPTKASQGPSLAWVEKITGNLCARADMGRPMLGSDIKQLMNQRFRSDDFTITEQQLIDGDEFLIIQKHLPDFVGGYVIQGYLNSGSRLKCFESYFGRYRYTIMIK